jgi:gluconate 5-dehydrogenase
MVEATTVWDLFSLKGKVAIVTGGAGQLGSQMCDALAEVGAHVVVASRNFKNCQHKARELTGKYNESIALQVDVTDKLSVQAMVEAVVQRFGHIDILVNNAYSGLSALFEEMTVEQWKSALDGAMTSTFLCSQAVSKVMMRQKKGVIINIASIYGIVAPDHRIYGRTGINSACNYGPAKAGVIQFTKWLAAYLAPYNIRVNCISPGGFYNEKLKKLPDYEEAFVPNYCSKTPLGRMGDQTDLKGVIVFLASDASKWMTGQNVVVDGGWTIW